LEKVYIFVVYVFYEIYLSLVEIYPGSDAFVNGLSGDGSTHGPDAVFNAQPTPYIVSDEICLRSGVPFETGLYPGQELIERALVPAHAVSVLIVSPEAHDPFDRIPDTGVPLVMCQL
jgi:hypothetical protein